VIFEGIDAIEGAVVEMLFAKLIPEMFYRIELSWVFRPIVTAHSGGS